MGETWQVEVRNLTGDGLGHSCGSRGLHTPLPNLPCPSHTAHDQSGSPTFFYLKKIFVYTKKQLKFTA